MSVDFILFYAFAVMAIGSALLLVSIRNTARALFLLFIVLFAMAGLYLFALADFVAITQILVYVGGVLILLIFAFMLSNKSLLSDIHTVSHRLTALPNLPSFLLASVFLAILLFALSSWNNNMPEWMAAAEADGSLIQPTENNIRMLGFKFMTQYVLPFEIISIFLMMALIGAAHISRKGERP
ncbi:NADH-quinone oxidoreductase subunit J family protein [Sphingobacterium griseoflavum]|uniref:NADH-quinone oxidoreductase subunit J n=1 Tax=Sphingobacterium griseoflavum TaxID=1474952 RepID=A0ABQ3HX78_9SPHI|nr:NADH-quinone oxidoreductase subunit J [Sphingobacterium griseoflavum]GHE43657.1 NADH-quinone oxidoreductase subunit J [Sphingobacterium griseoflavum]